MSDEDDYEGGDLFDSEKEEDEDGDTEVSTRTVSKCCLFVGIDFFTSIMKNLKGVIITVTLGYMRWDPIERACKNPVWSFNVIVPVLLLEP